MLRKEIKLLDFQKEGIAFFLKKKFCGIHDEQGLGKTLQALAAICEIKKKALVVVPPYLVQNWLYEGKKFTTLQVNGWSHKTKIIANDVDVYVIGYTQLSHAEDLFEWASIIICDESHYLKNLDSKRTEYFFNFFKKHKPEYYLSLSGTPIKNRIPEVYPFLLLLSLNEENKVKVTDRYDTLYKFCVRFTHIKNNKFGGFVCSGMKNVEELRSLILPWVIRRLAKDVLDLPELLETNVIASYKVDSSLEKEFSRFNDNFTVGDIKAKQESAVNKANFTADYIQELKKPVVVFSDHLAPLNIIEQKLNGHSVGRITGAVEKDKRSDIIKKFQEGKIDYLLATIGACSTGVTLTAANTLVFNDISWVPGDIEQAKKRIHRIGQKEICKIVYVVGSKADEYIIRSIRSKSQVINAVVDNEKPIKEEKGWVKA
jgi:SNF2 family DNA or RNA helicase